MLLELLLEMLLANGSHTHFPSGNALAWCEYAVNDERRVDGEKLNFPTFTMGSVTTDDYHGEL